MFEVTCQHEGLNLRGEVAIPSAPGPHPAVLVVHTAFGLGDHMREVAGRLAGQGYLALAVDMFGEATYSEDHSVIAELVKPLWSNSERLRSRMAAWLAVLRVREDVARDRVAALGYCFGGQSVLELARSGAEVELIVSYHGILDTNRRANPGAIRAHVAVFNGALDPNVPQAHVDALRAELAAGGSDWQITEFGKTYHAFTDPRAATQQTGRHYDPLADKISWENTLTLLNRRLRG